MRRPAEESATDDTRRALTPNCLMVIYLEVGKSTLVMHLPDILYTEAKRLRVDDALKLYRAHLPLASDPRRDAPRFEAATQPRDVALRRGPE